MDKKNTLQHKEAKLPCPCKRFEADFSTKENRVIVNCKNRNLCGEMLKYLERLNKKGVIYDNAGIKRNK